MGNGNKAMLAREKNAKAASTGGGSQLKTNVSAMSLQCTVCKQTFMSTTQPAALTEHATNKHSKALLECFIGYVDPKTIAKPVVIQNKKK